VTPWVERAERPPRSAPRPHPRFGRAESRCGGAGRGTGRAKGAPCAVHVVRVAAGKCARKYRRPATPRLGPPARHRAAPPPAGRKPLRSGAAAWTGVCAGIRALQDPVAGSEALIYKCWTLRAFGALAGYDRRLLRTPAHAVGSARGVRGGERW